jgi:hypothetical protein
MKALIIAQILAEIRRITVIPLQVADAQMLTALRGMVLNEARAMSTNELASIFQVVCETEFN